MDAKAAFIPLFIAAILGTAAVIPFGVGQQALAQTGTNQTGTTGNQTQTGTTTGNQTNTNQTDTTGNQGSASGPRSNNDALRGPIASVQLDENGEPAWIQSGIWVMRILGSQTGNQTGADQNVQFIARFAMVMPDGTAMHRHSIYGFQASDITQEGNSTVIDGTATVTMREGPVQDVPVMLQISSDTVLAISIDSEAVDAHFGDGPVYGLLSPFSRSIIQDELTEAEDEEEGAPEEEEETPPEDETGDEEEETPPPTNQTSTIVMTVEGDDEESYRWLADDELNPTLEMVAGNETTIEIDNPTDEEHNLVIESDGEVLEESGDIAAGEDGTLTITPEEEGMLDYHCEYHPETMVGTIEVSSSS